MGCSGFRRGGISALELQRLLSSGVAELVVRNGSNVLLLKMSSGGVASWLHGDVEVRTDGDTWVLGLLQNTSAIAVSVNGLDMTLDADIDGDVTVTGELSAGLLSRTPILPLIVEQALAGGTISLLNAETGCVGRFVNDGTAGTIELPASPSDGWQCRLILSGSFAGDPFTISTNSVAVYCPWYSGIDGYTGGLIATGPAVIDFHWDATNGRWVVTHLAGSINVSP